MTITSPAFKEGEFIPANYTCDGRDVSPPLTIEGVPIIAGRIPGTMSLALIVDDPDAPAGTLRPGSGQSWVHWVLYNMSPTVQFIPENSITPGAFKPIKNSPGPTSPPIAEQGRTNFGTPGYGGPCPPSGTHRYFFKLYALDTIIKFNEPPSATELEQAMAGHIIDRAQLMGRYARIKI